MALTKIGVSCPVVGSLMVAIAFYGKKYKKIRILAAKHSDSNHIREESNFPLNGIKLISINNGMVCFSTVSSP